MNSQRLFRSLAVLAIFMMTSLAACSATNPPVQEGGDKFEDKDNDGVASFIGGLSAEGKPDGTDNCPNVANPPDEVVVVGFTCSDYKDCYDPEDDTHMVNGEPVPIECVDPEKGTECVPQPLFCSPEHQCVVQANLDNDPFGDACDQDVDGDGVVNDDDNCPELSNVDQVDSNNNGVGDACETDMDGDGVVNDADNCKFTPNPDQADTDGDRLGDACDDDTDGDGVKNAVDNCRDVPNADQLDTDGDKVGDACDNDDDGDGHSDAVDNCPMLANVDQLDLDMDGLGDACDDDRDGDGFPNGEDKCPDKATVYQTDTDGDGLGDACDDDYDGDGVNDNEDNCPGIPNDQTDTDGDGLGDACDSDCDGDGMGSFDGSDCLDDDLDNDGFTVEDGDCNDTDPNVHPKAVETCNGKDDDCDGGTDNFVGVDDCEGMNVCYQGSCQLMIPCTSNDECDDGQQNTSDVCNTNLSYCEFTCVPNCDGKSCGSDGCGGTCGDGCASDEVCYVSEGSCSVPDWWGLGIESLAGKTLRFYSEQWVLLSSYTLVSEIPQSQLVKHQAPVGTFAIEVIGPTEPEFPCTCLHNAGASLMAPCGVQEHMGETYWGCEILSSIDYTPPGE